MSCGMSNTPTSAMAENRNLTENFGQPIEIVSR
jgi:hypothetical protein